MRRAAKKERTITISNLFHYTIILLVISFLLSIVIYTGWAKKRTIVDL